jgi:hypothetical protein
MFTYILCSGFQLGGDVQCLFCFVGVLHARLKWSRNWTNLYPLYTGQIGVTQLQRRPKPHHPLAKQAELGRQTINSEKAKKGGGKQAGRKK